MINWSIAWVDSETELQLNYRRTENPCVGGSIQPPSALIQSPSDRPPLDPGMLGYFWKVSDNN